MEKVIEYVKKNSWFDFDESGEDYAEFSTREHGSVGHELPGIEDIVKARELSNNLQKMYNVKVKVETVDEWTLLFISQNPF